jgi:Lar family restriction alleviation protein
MSEELKPCPFCGGKAERHTIEDEEPSNAGGDVICCSRCGASSHVEFGRKENLVSVWNTRPELTTLRAENELMREVVSDLLPRGVCWDNPNIPDNTVIPVDMTMGEIRKARNALAQVGQ